VLRFRTKEELYHSLEEKGFKVKDIYGYWNKSSLKEDSPEFIFVVQKK